jgi:hypothetical protein
MHLFFNRIVFQVINVLHLRVDKTAVHIPFCLKLFFLLIFMPLFYEFLFSA